MTSYYKLTSLNFLKFYFSYFIIYIACWTLCEDCLYNSVLFTILGLKLALCCSLKFASDVFVRPKGHGIWLFLVMESLEKSWNLNFQKEYEPC